MLIWIFLSPLIDVLFNKQNNIIDLVFLSPLIDVLFNKQNIIGSLHFTVKWSWGGKKDGAMGYYCEEKKKEME